ncbi:MAG: hypothetical protein WCL07_01895 [bacterium]
MLNNFLSTLGTVWIDLASSLASSLPNIIGGLTVFVFGIILGNFARTAVIKGLQALKFENLIKDTKFREFLSRAELTEKVEVMLGSLAKWLIVITFFIAATNIWGLTTVSQLLLGIVSYLPNVISAVIVLTLGILLAGLVESMVKAGLSSVDIRTGRLMGKLSSYLVVTIAILAAFSELRIARDFINTIFIGFVAMISLGFGLAIGLGGKQVVSDALGQWYKSIQKDLNPKN